jgi:membrane-associated phospholipid phosphatase
MVTVPSGMVLNALTKLAFQRARPSFDNPILTLSSYSFPSGHVAAATLFYGVLAALLIAKTSEWRWRVLILLVAIVLVALVALTRMYLVVHYLSDVMAAFAQALAWLALCRSQARKKTEVVFRTGLPDSPDTFSDAPSHSPTSMTTIKPPPPCISALLFVV